MFYTIYQITNLINNKIYIGLHKTRNLDDGYMGSGKLIRFAIKEHGIENFAKEILFVFDNPKEMIDKEIELVTKSFCLREDTYNLALGGGDGFSYVNDGSIKHKERASKAGKIGVKETQKKFVEKYGVKSNFHIKEKQEHMLLKRREKYGGSGFELEHVRLSAKNSIKDKYNVENVSQIPEINQKIKETLKKKEHAKGRNNPNFGKFWITNGKENLMVKTTEEILPGWTRGRFIKSTKDKL